MSLPAFVTRLLGRLSILPFRVVAYVLHATGLEHIYKPNFRRHAALIDIDDEMITLLPKYSQTMTGAMMDPMNLIIVGSEEDVRRAFKAAKWTGSSPASPIHLLYSGLSVLLGRTNSSGPFTPHYVSIGLQDFGYQKLTRLRSFRQRHHVRIWKTGITLQNDKTVWVAAGSYDVSLKVQLSPPFIHHSIDPDLDREREFIAKQLENAGAVRLKYVHMIKPVRANRPATNASGMRYHTDGRAVLMELRDGA